MFLKEISLPKKINRDLALVAGMLVGDGSMPKKHNGSGRRNYLLYFGNTDYTLVKLFSDKIYELFKVKGRISCLDRNGRKRFFTYYCYSKKLVKFFVNLGINDGKKSRAARVPKDIYSSKKSIRASFLKGLIITDGSLRKDETLLFHCASKHLLRDTNRIISEDTVVRKKSIKKFVQGKFCSYQLSYSRGETRDIRSYAEVA